MLAITRKEGEGIIIDRNIQIIIKEIDGNKVKLGISAPDSMEILRDELLEDRN